MVFILLNTSFFDLRIYFLYVSNWLILLDFKFIVFFAISSYFAGVLRVKSYTSVFIEVLWRTMIQLLSNETTPPFKLLPMPLCLYLGCVYGFKLGESRCKVGYEYGMVGYPTLIPDPQKS